MKRLRLFVFHESEYYFDYVLKGWVERNSTTNSEHSNGLCVFLFCLVKVPSCL